jgi:uncharacterized protein (DUF934 family)
MSDIIVRGAVVPDTFITVDSLEALASVSARQDVLASLAVWQAAPEALIERSARRGLLLAADADPAAAKAFFKHLDLLAVSFPSMTDGRGFSLGYLLRTRLGWRGELRAIGPLVRDQLQPLARVGFDAMSLRAGQDLHAALASLRDFSAPYQASADEPRPLFARTELEHTHV